QPKELKQFTTKSENKGQFYAFFSQKKQNRFELLVAQTDTESKNKSIERLYSKLKNIHFEKKNLTLKTNANQEILVEIDKENLLFQSDKSTYKFNTENGILLKEN